MPPESFIVATTLEKPKHQAELDEARINAQVARGIYELRTRVRVTQRQLAKLVGTTASVICRLEDSDYDGHSLAMLGRIAFALHQRLEIRFVPTKRRLQQAWLASEIPRPTSSIGDAI
jgi:transcriptional regulator with XRE-family HTH domain